MCMGATRRVILAVLVDGEPRSSRSIVRATGLSGSQVHNALRRA